MEGKVVTTTEDLISRAEALGARFELEAGEVIVSARQPLPGALMADLRQCRAEVAAALSGQPVCLNPLTPHASHEFPWECNPDECYCYRHYRRPRLCQGVPCRWVWSGRSSAD